MAQRGFKTAVAFMLGAIAVVSSAAIAQAQSRIDWLNSGDSITYDGYLYAGEAVQAICDCRLPTQKGA
ncbi:MAG: hypothetical protein EA368_04110 [Leptolyngbya sp. DLM2.Bin27]|nr:MAG: hypothetical protein EA368_04110 [Leptolyngbya sp. DLM2.Bin27]